MKETNRPINDFLLSYMEKKPISFHMPGHNGGKLFDGKYRKNIAAFDITEIPGADTLFQPKGIIQRSQQRIANTYGAEQTHFLVNGSTLGLYAIMKYAAMINPKMIVSRDVHVSILNAAMLFGMELVFFNIDYDYKDHIPLTGNLSHLEQVIKENPDCAGVLITSPNYYGMTADMDTVRQMTDQHDMFLAVDQAHGAHFPFHSRFPKNACLSNADMVCMSAHKTLPALNQGGFLHTKKSIEIEGLIKMLQTTSPSYPILASLENAVCDMIEKGEEEYEELFDRIRDFTNRLYEDERYFVHDTNDFCRLVINVIKTGRSGFEIAQILNRSHEINIEMADLFNIVLITTWANTKNDFLALEKALKNIESVEMKAFDFQIPDIPKSIVSVSKAFSLPKKEIELAKANDKICGAIVLAYPPGVPLLCPGEKITKDIVEYIQNIKNAGGNIMGLVNDDMIEVLL